MIDDSEARARRTVRGSSAITVAGAVAPPNNPDGTLAPAQKLADFTAISEEKLRALGDMKLRELLNNGYIGQMARARLMRNQRTLGGRH